ncbi:MAG: response regulator [Aminipila sp.]
MEEETTYDFTGCRVLIADHSEFSAEATKELLEMVGIEVRCAHDGEEAVKLFFEVEPEFYDIILMDIEMPKYDGYEATNMIRNSRYGNANSVIILAMAMNPSGEEVNLYRKAGMDGYIEKTFDAGNLYKLLNSYYKI